jgi:hypothetical protein
VGEYDNVQRGEIVDYETEAGPLPMLVVHVNNQENGDGTVIGHVFDMDGSTRQVVIPQEAPEPEEDFDALRAKLEAHDRAQEAAERPAAVTTGGPAQGTTPEAVSAVPASENNGGNE